MTQAFQQSSQVLRKLFGSIFELSHFPNESEQHDVQNRVQLESSNFRKRAGKLNKPRTENVAQLDVLGGQHSRGDQPFHVGVVGEAVEITHVLRIHYYEAQPEQKVHSRLLLVEVVVDFVLKLLKLRVVVIVISFVSFSVGFVSTSSEFVRNFLLPFNFVSLSHIIKRFASVFLLLQRVLQDLVDQFECLHQKDFSVGFGQLVQLALVC